jgi:hypothetical protein
MLHENALGRLSIIVWREFESPQRKAKVILKLGSGVTKHSASAETASLFDHALHHSG